ncbi:MAG: type II secretion system protein GspL [Acidiferrobacteraceae bacterium]
MGREVLAGMNASFAALRRHFGLPGGAAHAAEVARLVIWLPPGAAPHVAGWTLREPGARERTGAAPLSEIAGAIPLPRGARIEVLTPPYDTLLASVSLPTQSRARLAQALPFALEDQLLGEPEQFHMTYRALGGDVFAVAVTAKERLLAWRQALADAAITPDVLCPANLRLPWAEGEWSVRFAPDGLWVRTGPFSGFASAGASREPPAILTAALADARARGSAPERLRLYDPPRDLDHDRWRALGVALEEAQGAPMIPDESPPFNLLRGIEDEHSPLFSALRPALIMLTLWVGIGFLIHFAEWARLHHIEARQRAQMVALFRQSFPHETEIVDPAVQMRRGVTLLRRQSGLVGPNDLLPLLERVAQSVRGGPPGVVLHSLAYRHDRLRISLTAPGFNALDTFKDRLRGNGLTVRMGAADSHGKTVRGSMEVRAQP